MLISAVQALLASSLSTCPQGECGLTIAESMVCVGIMMLLVFCGPASASALQTLLSSGRCPVHAFALVESMLSWQPENSHQSSFSRRCWALLWRSNHTKARGYPSKESSWQRCVHVLPAIRD